MSAKKEPRRENEQNGSEKTDGMSSSQVPYKNTLLIHLVFTFIRTSQARLNYVGLEAHWSSSSSSLKNGMLHSLSPLQNTRERTTHTHTERERKEKRKKRNNQKRPRIIHHRKRGQKISKYKKKKKTRARNGVQVKGEGGR